MDYQGLQTLFNLSQQAPGAVDQGVTDYQTQLEKQQALDLAAQKNPLLVQNQALINQGLEADLPGKQATSRKLGVEADTAEALKGSDITTKQSSNDLTLLGNKIKTAEAQHAQAVQAAAYIGDGPDAEARKMELLRSGQISPGPLYDAISNTPAKQLKAKLQSASEAIARSKDDYIQKIASVHAKGAEDRALEQQQYEHGKYNRGNVLSWSQKFETMPLDRQMVTLAGALQSGRSPISGEPMTQDEQQYFNTRYLQAKQILDAQNAARAQAANQGIAPTVGPQGDVTLSPRAPLPSTGLPTGGNTPPPQLSPQDQQAVDWAKGNPNDPRAQRILKLHGM